ncbi:hypothetical protein [Sphingobacterium lactis]|uniref:Uncharacterized protein n=1 Tax=Sphingobacterium lactis TaxID=797291 RepID=A0A1H5TW28_9SPHI|nr:hypothetical protein [Sphingobacterium lactis]SEF66970.1 hypothetical protein SAMN05421877_10297 [Sphingobacterium lactis]
MKYRFNEEFARKNSNEIWGQIIVLLKTLKPNQIPSISGKKIYEVVTANEQSIGFLGNDRNGQEEEIVFKKDFISLLDVLQTQSCFSTSSIKNYISGPIYKKRSPSFAILKFLQIIE